MSISRNFLTHLLAIIVLIFFCGYTAKAINSMINIPFNEFDEAHRAETAKRMREYQSYLIPITGSVYDRVINLRIPFRDNPFKFLYFHLERPPLVYDLMILSTFVFGTEEFAYRLPSFILGMVSVLILIIFIKILSEKVDKLALILSLVCLLTSADLWLSSQYAQLDTAITTFLFLALLSLIAYIEKNREKFLFISAISFSLAILSKGQPTIIFLLPLIFLFLTKRISRKSLIRFMVYSSLLLVPWIGYASFKFGAVQFVEVFTKFAFSTNIQDVVHHKAPFFWYARWWWETFRPGWSLFLALFLIDLIKRNISWQKTVLLIYIFGNFIWLSLNENKLWWYVLPLVPVICFYIYLSSRDYLLAKKSQINLAIAIIIASRPPIAEISNRLAIFYGLFFTLIIFYLLFGLNISNTVFRLKNNFLKIYDLVFVLAILFSLIAFYLRFPKIIPYHPTMKSLATYFANLPGNKCLWIYDIPTESVLFYSDAGELHTYELTSAPFGHCTNYLITTARFKKMNLEKREGDVKLYKF